MTEKQITLIKKLLAEKDFNQFNADNLAYDIELLSGKTIGCEIDLNNLEALDNRTASKLIDALIKADSKTYAQKKAEHKATAMIRHEKMVEWAKGQGVKVTARMKASTIREKIFDAGLEIPAEFQGQLSNKTQGVW